jgi:hypothetical protein
MIETNWRNTVITSLAIKPEEWRPLGKVFIEVADAIPMHSALRRLASSHRIKAKRDNRDTDIEATDLDLNKAQWLYFNAFVLPLVERKNSTPHAKHSDLVRLKPDKPCEDCGGPTYLKGWGERRGERRQYFCPTCTLPKPRPKPKPVQQPLLTVVQQPEQVSKPVALLPAPLPKPAPPPQPKLRLIPIVRPQPQPKLVKTPPPPPPKPLEDCRSLDEIYKQFLLAADKVKIIIPSYNSYPKLHKLLHRALEAGALDEYKRLTLWRQSELVAISHPFLGSMNIVWKKRADDWMVTGTGVTAQYRKKWRRILQEAYAFGCLGITCIIMANHTGNICEQMDIMVSRSEPLPKPKKTIKQRWVAPIKRAVARWRIK